MKPCSCNFLKQQDITENKKIIKRLKYGFDLITMKIVFFKDLLCEEGAGRMFPC